MYKSILEKQKVSSLISFNSLSLSLSLVLCIWDFNNQYNITKIYLFFIFREREREKIKLQNFASMMIASFSIFLLLSLLVDSIYLYVVKILVLNLREERANLLFSFSVTQIHIFNQLYKKHDEIIRSRTFGCDFRSDPRHRNLRSEQLHGLPCKTRQIIPKSRRVQRPTRQLPRDRRLDQRL